MSIQNEKHLPPSADDSKRPERAEPARKRILIFRLYPDDDIISMGGTYKRLQELGREVYIGYQAPGNIAVADDEVLRFVSFVCDYNEEFGIKNTKADDIYKKAVAFLKNKKVSKVDITEVLYIKGLMRKGKAQSTCYFVVVPENQIHFVIFPILRDLSNRLFIIIYISLVLPSEKCPSGNIKPIT